MMKTKKIAIISITLAICFALVYLDKIFFNFNFPGFKLGLANICVLFALYKWGVREAILISASKILISSVMFFNVYSFTYSLFGGIFSLVTIIIFYKIKIFSIFSIGVIGAISHNLAQYFVCLFYFKNIEITLKYYLPLMLIFAIFSGLLVSFISSKILKCLKNERKFV